MYPPGLTPPQQPHDLALDINRWSWSQSFDGLLDVPRMLTKMNALPYRFSATVTEQQDGVDSPLGRVWKCSLTSGRGDQLGQSCYGNRYGSYALADIEAYFTDHLFQYISGAPQYEVPIFQFNAAPPLASPLFAGFASSNDSVFGWTPTELPQTRQSFVFTSTTPDRNTIFGHGNLLRHEVGHHLGFSHPFQGYRGDHRRQRRRDVGRDCHAGNPRSRGTHPAAADDAARDRASASGVDQVALAPHLVASGLP